VAGSPEPHPLRSAFRGRASAQRLAIAEATDAMTGAFSVEQLAATVRPAGIGKATVYRAVTAMRETGFLEQVGAHDGSALYVRCRSADHHHHVVCTGCGAVADAPCGLDGVLGAAVDASGYELTAHTLTLYGTCPECRRRA
jgi:Fur family ferric uptake transcriptional regulator